MRAASLWAECLQSLGFECIDQPGCKSRLRANHGHVYAVASNEVDDCIDIFHTDCHAFCIFCDSGIARAQYILSTLGERFSAFTMAWQRPPPPTTRTFLFIVINV